MQCNQEYVDIAGVDDEGQLIYQLSEQGKEIAKGFDNQSMIVSAKFERFGNFDPHCLNLVKRNFNNYLVLTKDLPIFILLR